MQDTTTALIDAQGGKKYFNYDYSFWSHDDFIFDEEGYNYPATDKYADQTKLYDLIGSNVLVNAWYKLGRVTTLVFLHMGLHDRVCGQKGTHSNSIQ